MRLVNKQALASIVVGAILSFALPGAAEATVAYKFTSTKIDPTVGGLVGTIHDSYQSGHHTKTLVESASIGRLQLSGTADGNAVSFHSYCVDLFDLLKPGTFSDGSLDSLNLTPIRLSQLTTFIENADALVSSKKSAVYSAAAQLGVWEILYETNKTFDLTRGAFYASGGNLNGWGYSATKLANSWLANVSSGIWKAIPGSEVALLTPASRNQPQIYIRQVPASAVPEPATWVTMILGFGLLGAAMRRVRRAAHRKASVSTTGKYVLAD